MPAVVSSVTAKYQRTHILCCSRLAGLRTGVLILSGLTLFMDVIKLMEYSARFQIRGPNSIFNLLDVVIVGLGFYGALKNNIKYVKIFAIYQWINVAFTLLFAAFLALLSASAFGRDEVLKLCKDQQGKMPPEQRLDCEKYIGLFALTITAFAALTAGFALYFGFAVWSYYQDLRDSPEKYNPPVVVLLQTAPQPHPAPNGYAPIPADLEADLPPYAQELAGPNPTGIPGLPDGNVKAPK
ncbi:hypothetical protein HK104_000684 [Borealophlyctis nickersoniae]|nr:hypothetical protein HK104_000684 [Borealophlyctis nickersoniae]